MTSSRRHLLGQFAGMGLASTAVSRATSAADDKILRIGYGGLPSMKGNPFANIQVPSILLTGGIFDGLTRLTKDGGVAPWLATSWQAIDALTWRFTLRDDIQFSNGKPFDAGAVLHAVEHLSGPGSQQEGMRRDLRFLDGGRVIDKHTIDIRTTYPVPMFPRYCAVLLIVEPDAWQSMGAEQFAETPVGTGPLTIQSWAPALCEARRNPTSWRPLAIDGVDFMVLPDVSSRIQAILSGGLDVAYQLAPDDFPTIETIGGRIASVKDGACSTFMLQYTDGRDTPLQDKRVRHALNYAVDKQTIVDVLLGGATAVSSQATVREAFGYDPTLAPYAYDPDKARALLAEAGYADGFDLVIESPGSGTNGWLVIQRVADDLNRVGVRADVRQKPVMRFLLDFVQGRIDADAFQLQWGTYPILDCIQTTNINSCRMANPWYCDETIQPVIEQAWTEADEEKALALRHQVMRHYHDEAPCIYLYENIAFQGLAPRVSGYHQTFGYIHFEDIRIA